MSLLAVHVLVVSGYTSASRGCRVWQTSMHMSLATWWSIDKRTTQMLIPRHHHSHKWCVRKVAVSWILVMCWQEFCKHHVVQTREMLRVALAMVLCQHENAIGNKYNHDTLPSWYVSDPGELFDSFFPRQAVSRQRELLFLRWSSPMYCPDGKIKLLPRHAFLSKDLCHGLIKRDSHWYHDWFMNPMH